MNYSFWADEAYVAGLAAQLVLGKLSLLQALNGISYQKLYVATLAFFFKLFGISEFTARLPSIFAFVLGIAIMFLIAKKLSNIFGAIVSSLLFTFSHLNLAYATQAKPYVFLESITLFILLLLLKLSTEKDRKRIYMYHVGIIFLLFIATFLHTIGILMWIMYGVYLMQKIYTQKSTISFKTFGLAKLFILTLIVGILSIVALPYLKMKFLPYNNLYQVLKLFAYKYTFISVCSALGFIWMFKKHKVIGVALLTYSIGVLLMASFQQYIFNIRYVLTLFGVLFLYFGIFWAKVGERYQFKIGGKAVIPIVVMILIYTTGYKIVRWPQTYYSPNIDKYGDVQIANYKDFYAQLKHKFPDYKNLYVVNDTFDVEYWYFGRYSNAYFMKFTEKPYKHHTADAYVYGSLNDFKKIIKENPQGLLVMEDWQSFLPDDIKEYAKKNLRLEFRVESLRESPDDPWPLALYSWGF